MEKRELKELIAETVREVLYELLKSDASNEQFSAERLRRAILIRAKKAEMGPQIEAQGGSIICTL